MRLSRSYQPRTLSEVVGQPAVIRRLKRLVAAPQPCCLLFEGLGGVGKSAAAKALIQGGKRENGTGLIIDEMDEE